MLTAASTISTATVKADTTRMAPATPRPTSSSCRVLGGKRDSASWYRKCPMLRNAGATRFSLLQLVLACVALVTVAACSRSPASTGPNVEPEAEGLKAKYGPAKNSYGPEEWIVRDFFQDKRDGVFLDVGANHYKSTSNTYYLEQHLNWSGVAIDALQEFAADYQKFRPRTKFFTFFVADKSNERAKMYVLEKNKQIGSGEKAFAEQHGEKAKEIEVPTITLTDLLD